MLADKISEYIGCLCEVYSIDNDLLVIARLKVVRTEPCLTVEFGASDGGDMPKVTQGTEIKICIVNNKLGFLGLYGRVYIINEQFWRAEDIRVLGEQERRGYFRVKNSSTASICPVDEDAEAGDPCESMCQGLVTNVSLSGLLLAINADDCSLKIGTRLRVWGFSIGDAPHQFIVFCRVRRVMQHPVAGRLYGCEFEKLDEKESDKLCQALFAQQSIEIRRRRGIS